MRNFSSKLIDWYNENKRDLPWRQVSDPYRIWLSEIILQQTRVNQGLPYYHNFIERFPNVEDLAAANESDILRVWQGLGYYSRARNLHKCAKIVVTEHGGKFPNTFKQLLTLPGIGPYTAAAIASFAFGERVAVVDGNVYRVLARIFGIDADIASSKGQTIFQKKANSLISKLQPATFNQAIMEFGALQCVPKSPDCENCTFNIECSARKQHKQDFFPVKTKKLKIKKRFFNYIVFANQGQVLLKERTNKDIWQGLFDFWLIEADQLKDEEDVLNSKDLKTIRGKVLSVEQSRDYKHILSHQHIHARFFLVQLSESIENLQIGRFYDYEDIMNLPKPVLISSYLNTSIFGN